MRNIANVLILSSLYVGVSAVTGPGLCITALAVFSSRAGIRPRAQIIFVMILLTRSRLLLAKYGVVRLINFLPLFSSTHSALRKLSDIS